MITHVDVVTLYVADQAAMTSFFTEQMGFAKRTDAEMGPGKRWIEVVPEGARTSLALLAARDFDRAPDTEYPLTFACPDLEAAGPLLEERGVAVGEIVSEFWGSYRWITDPEGRRFIIAHPEIGR